MYEYNRCTRATSFPKADIDRLSHFNLLMSNPNVSFYIKNKAIGLAVPMLLEGTVVVGNAAKCNILSCTIFCFISLQVSFNVSVEARGCAPRGNNQSFTVKPVGFKDYLEVSVDYQCDCGCSRTAQTNSSICNSIGTSSCFTFWSNFTWIYNHTNSCPITLDQLLVCFCLHDLKTGLNVFKRAT